MLTRRTFLAAAATLPLVRAADAASFDLRYLLSSAMYGQESLADVLAEAGTLGITALDLWPKVHGAQREEVDALGIDRVVAMASEANCRIECLTRYDLGAAGIGDEIDVAAALGAGVIVTGPKGSKTPAAAETKAAVAVFAREMRPLAAKAADAGVKIAIENHRRNLFESADSLRYLADAAPEGLRIALAPAHLPQNPADIARLIDDIGHKLSVFYAWERGTEFIRKEPTGRELQQLPGRGSFDFAPLVAALRRVNYDGLTSIFMHPIPRGIPAAGTIDATTAAIREARTHLDSLL